jgi:D-alanine-D-alanine ligase
MTKKRVCILFGGRSAEHEVSLMSAKNVFDALDKGKYEAVPVGIDKDGKWLLFDSGGAGFLLDADDPKKVRLAPGGKPVALLPGSGGVFARLDEPGRQTAVDVVFPILHGPLGEDGSVQGLFKLAGVPFAGSSVLGSAVGMDKEAMKRLLREADIPIAKYVTLRAKSAGPDFNAVKKMLAMPVFVKPANMGSSVGVNKAHDEAEYLQFTREAFRYDSKVIVEEFISGRELECSVLGNESPGASIPGEIVPLREFYSYEAKYIDENGAKLVIPAELPPPKTVEIQALAVRTYKALYAEGLARVDFLMRDDGKIFVNEINTMPGFTKISMYPKLWEECGIGYGALIDRIIEAAFERHEAVCSLKTDYQ